MRIEKISDTQVKFYLTNEDLTERNIKLSELVFGSEKAQALFREITEQAADTCGFSPEGDGDSIPLMVEAKQSADGIVIIVSRLTDMNELQGSIENRLSGNAAKTDFGLSPASMTERKFKKAVPPLDNYKIPDDDSSIIIYKFDNLDTAERLSKVAADYFCDYTDSRLYLCDKIYYLFIDGSDITGIDKKAFDGIASQYGSRHPSNSIAIAYIREHGDVVIKNNAVKILAEL